MGNYGSYKLALKHIPTLKGKELWTKNSDQMQENLLTERGQLQVSQTNRWRVHFLYS